MRPDLRCGGGAQMARSWRRPLESRLQPVPFCAFYPESEPKTQKAPAEAGTPTDAGRSTQPREDKMGPRTSRETFPCGMSSLSGSQLAIGLSTCLHAQNALEGRNGTRTKALKENRLDIAIDAFTDELARSTRLGGRPPLARPRVPVEGTRLRSRTTTPRFVRIRTSRSSRESRQCPLSQRPPR